ncbi:signal peptidase I [bacterium]|nr:signal peptidase I [bacterium]
METVVVVLLLRAFVVEAHAVPTGSMIPTILPGEYLLAEKLSYRFGDPQGGDVVVFKYPVEPKVDYVKRCLAVGGQTFEIKDRKPIIDGLEVPDSHAHFENTLPPVPNILGISDSDWQKAWESRDLFGQVMKLVSQKPGIVKSLYAFVATYEANSAGMEIEYDSLRTAITNITPKSNRWDEYLRIALIEGFEAYLDTDFSSEEVIPIINKALTYNMQQLIYFSISDNFQKVTIPEGYLMCIGDNRDQSYDSRFWGPVPLDNVKGRPSMIYYSVEVQPPAPGKTPTIFDNILIIFKSWFHPKEIRPDRFFTLLF